MASFWLPPARSQRLVLGLILGFALGVRLALWLQPVHLPANDEQEYLRVARDLAAGQGWRLYDSYPWLRAPLYPLWLAGMLTVSGGSAQQALLGQIGLSVIQIFGLWLLGRELAGRSARAVQAGLWTAGLGATLLTLATFANLWMAETLWNGLWTFALIAILRWWRQPGPGMAATAGVLTGLAILTRSLPLFFVPVLVGWMLWRCRSRRGLVHALVLCGCCGAIIAPWTLRNALAYSAFIPVETGFSYNLWAFNNPPIELDELGRRLAAIRNPAERAAYASAQGRALLSADPLIMIRKIWPNTLYLWRVKPIEDRFLQQNYYSDPPTSYFIAALLFDDLWYVGLLGLAAWGISSAPRDGRLALALLWLGYVAGSTALTHGEARYRHFLLPIILAYAGASSARAGSQPPIWQRSLAASVGGGLVLLVIWSYPWTWAGTALARSWQHWQGQRALLVQDYPTALEYYQQAANSAQTPDSWIALGRARWTAGDLAGAQAAFEWAVRQKQDYPGAALALGEFLLAQGRHAQARQVWANQYLDQPVLLDWAWQHIQRPPPEQIEVGDGLDPGLVTGMYPAEQINGQAVRWTSSVARLRIAGDVPRMLTLRLANPRPAEQPAAQTTLCITDLGCQQLVLDAAWHLISLPLPAHAGPWEISIHSQPWTSATDQRQLGILIDRVQAPPLSK